MSEIGIENESLRIISVKKNHINISLCMQHDKILYNFRRYDWKAISFMRSWWYDIWRKDLQKVLCLDCNLTLFHLVPRTFILFNP